jgi:hypothetical protein
MHKNENTQNSHSFLALAFFRGICLSRHQRIWNQHKILRFFDTHIDIFQEKNFLGHNSTFCNLKMQMRKKLYIFKHFAKSKKLFFCQYLSFSVWFLLKFQKKYKIEAPYCTSIVDINQLNEKHTEEKIYSVAALPHIVSIQR